MTEEVKNDVDYKLPPEKQKVLGEIIESVLAEYDKESKFYTADTLHYLRSKITAEAKKQLGDDVVSVDVILDLRHVSDIRFGFKVNIPVPKQEV
jgi:hypothetical protein